VPREVRARDALFAAVRQKGLWASVLARRCSEDSERCADGRYFTSVSILNIGMYIEMMMMPTMTPTPIIMIGSTIEVSDCTDASTSSS
jgi:hypothetical protein